MENMEDASHMTIFAEGDSVRTTEEIMARRLKNRERQRRYRARKRLEADMRNSCMIEQRALMPIEPQFYGNNVSFSSGAFTPVETQLQNPTVSSAATVYSGRKWKKDARLAHALRREENGSIARSSSEADPNPEPPVSSTGRRDWKADARSKMDVSAPVSCQ